MKNRAAISLVMGVLILAICLLPNFYYREREVEEIEPEFERELKDRYGMDFDVLMLSNRTPGKFEAYVTPTKYDVNDSYYRTKANIKIYPFGIMSSVEENWHKVKAKLEREDLFLEKIEEFFGKEIRKNTVIKENSSFITRKEIEENKISEDNDFALTLDVFIFKQLANDNEISQQRKNIYQFVECLKEKNIFANSDIFFHYVDKRILAPSYERFDKYIDNVNLEIEPYNDSHRYIYNEKSRIMMSQALRSELNSWSKERIEEEINSLAKEDLDHTDDLRKDYQYNVNIITPNRLKNINYNFYDARYKKYERKKEARTLDEHVYDGLSKVQLEENDIYQFKDLNEISQKRVKYTNQQEDGKKLMTAIWRNNRKKVRKLIAEGLSLNFIDSNGNTPLMKAVERERYEIAEILLEKNDIINLETPLLIAVEQGLEDFVNLILAEKPDIENTILLYRAMQANNSTIEKELIKAGVAIEKLPLDKDATPLINAAVNNQAEKLNLLIEAGAKINKRDQKGRSVLIHAIKAENYNIVRNLIKQGAYINAKCNEGKSVFTYAKDTSNQQIINFLKELNLQDNTWNDFLEAVKREEKEKIEAYIEQGININAKDEEDNTALLIASSLGNQEIIELLIAEGAKINKSNHEKITPLMIAASRNDYQIVKSLLAAGANINAGDSRNYTALTFAVMEDNLAVVDLLIEKGANVDAETEFNLRTPLILAAEFGNAEVVELLIASGADIKARSLSGSALDKAKEKGHSKIVEILEDEI